MYIIYVNHDSVIKQICQLRDKAFLINETKIDHRQHVRKGYSTTDALLYMLQAVYEAVDSGGFCSTVLH